MKRLFLIVLPLFISVGLSQKLIEVIETFDSIIEDEVIRDLGEYGHFSEEYFKKVGFKTIDREVLSKIKDLFKKSGVEWLNQRYIIHNVTTYKETRNRLEKVKYVEYLITGQKKYEGTWKDGEYDGLWTEWYENGQKKKEGTFKDGELISSKEWNEDGSVKK